MRRELVIYVACLIFGFCLADNVANSATAAPPLTIAVTDGGWYFSPGNTYGDGEGTMQASNIPTKSTIAALLTAGAYARVAVANTGNLTLNVDVSRSVTASVAPDDYPILTYSVDSGMWTDFQLTSATTGIAVLAGSTVGMHTLELHYKADYIDTAKWIGSGSPSIPANAVVITSLTADHGATTVAPMIKPNVIYCFGDSITEGLRAINSTDTSNGNDAFTTHFVPTIAAAFSAEFCQIGYGATGFEHAGHGGAPSFPSNYSYYFSGASRLSSGHFVVQPKYIFVFHGTNGTTVQSDVAAMIMKLRTAAPNAWIFFVLPPTNNTAASALSAACAASDDTKIKYLAPIMLSIGTINTTDGIHPRSAAEPAYAAQVIQLAQSSVGGTTPGSRNTTTANP